MLVVYGTTDGHSAGVAFAVERDLTAAGYQAPADSPMKKQATRVKTGIRVAM